MVSVDFRVVVWVWVWCSTLATIFLPFPVIRRIHRDKFVGSISTIPFLSLLANAHVWAMYGFLGKAWFPNFPAFVIGDIVSWYYLFVYWKYSKERCNAAQIVAVVAAALAAPTLYVTVGFLGFTGQTRAQVWKTHGLCFCDVTVFSNSVFMVKNLVNAFNQRSAASINVRALVVGISYSCGWITYGHLYSNWIIAGPQVWIMMLHVSALIMCVVCKPKTLSDTASTIRDDEDSTELSIALPINCDADVGLREDNTREFHVLSSPVTTS